MITNAYNLLPLYNLGFTNSLEDFIFRAPSIETALEQAAYDLGKSHAVLSEHGKEIPTMTKELLVEELTKKK
jgi:hypothetical protein